MYKIELDYFYGSCAMRIKDMINEVTKKLALEAMEILLHDDTPLVKDIRRSLKNWGVNDLRIVAVRTISNIETKSVKEISPVEMIFLFHATNLMQTVIDLIEGDHKNANRLKELYMPLYEKVQSLIEECKMPYREYISILKECCDQILDPKRDGLETEIIPDAILIAAQDPLSVIQMIDYAKYLTMLVQYANSDCTCKKGGA